MLAIGLMSGTSMDGVDVALIDTDGHGVRPRNGQNGFAADTATYPYTPDQKALLQRAMAAAETIAVRTERPAVVAEAEAMITRVHGEAVAAALREWGLAANEIGVAGFHGQTVVHRPGEGLTLQIGNGAELARQIGIPVVYDLRAADVAAGGEGAPLVPVFHRALAAEAGFAPPLAILNIGGVANVTFIGSGDQLAGFDTGPGNALLDDLMRERGGADYDEGGTVSASGRPDEPLLRWLLAHPYFDKRPPKSLDRNWFSHRLVGHLSLPDAAATLAAFTAGAVGKALAWADETPRRWIVGGGGARNRDLLRRIGDAVGVAPETADAVGWSADGLEAQAFAYLAARHFARLPITFPGTTGVREPMRGGVLASP